MTTKLKQNITGAFKMHGFTLRSEASKYLVDVLNLINEVQREDCLDKIIESVQKQQLSSTLIDRSVCEQAVQECNTDQDESDDVFGVIDAFAVPRFTYVTDRKKFIESDTVGIPPPCLHGTAADKNRLFTNKYTMLLQRTQRHDLFTPPVIGAQMDESSKKFQLKPIEYLLGSTAKLGEIIVLGMLTQLKEGKWYLEDPTGVVQIDLSEANFQNGLFTENCFVLAEGWYEDKIFHINAFGFPPPEPAKTTRSYFGNINFFGGFGNQCAKASSKLRQIEQDNEDAMFVFLSDVWLDQVKVMEKLRILFAGYADFPPTCFILCGNFLSSHQGSQHVKIMKECFHNLTELICEFPTLVESSRFIFVPGPQDPGPMTILPRPPIPNSVTEDIRKKIPSAQFTSNPCRIQYCTQEIVVFREEIVTKMCRNCVKFPEDGEVPSHFCKTIVSQGHLCPLPLHVCPVYWAYDAGLQLYPLPDLVVCADKFDPFHTTSVDCTVMNPGSFPRTEFSFKVYLPATKQIEDSKIGD
ncbi:DNA polymerase epsilon subunit 2 [Mytilus galloprovincialis]|uniref:DNA polymerase epsilon subunit n=1 Tax=Mytilus galloprovincialis TaxID=29158 RepID=A0A8B6BNC4_MYTGA|nr:DNA polymerase epsilon subunit 2 [Mytilus galloprovincialis]